jgi:hypothetical protein
MSVRRVTVVTAGHLATCPRMLKAADAFHGAGYAVRVISTASTPWAIPADRELHASRRWRWEVIDVRRRATLPWLWNGVRARAAEQLARALETMTPFAIVQAAYARFHHDLVRAILRERQDFIYGGTTGAIGAVAEASRRSGTACGVDFEDFHCGEQAPGAYGSLHNRLARQIMTACAAQASFVTAGSAAIADACREELNIAAIPVHNVFSLPARAVTPVHTGPLRLYWFSQTIGPGRGLDDVVTAVGRADKPCELHLRGVAAMEYVSELEKHAQRNAPALRLHVHPPSSPERMVEDCREFDVGIAAEDVKVPNRALALSNKALTYPLAPLAIALTSTRGQQPLARDLHGHAVTYAPGDTRALAEGLSEWMSDRHRLQEAKDAAWEAARSRWHWEHPLERDALLAAVAAA